MATEEELKALDDKIKEEAAKLAASQQTQVFDKLSHTLEGLGQRLESIEQRQSQPPPKEPEKPIDDVSDDDYRAERAKAMQSGDWSVVDKMEKIRSNAREERLRREHKREMAAMEERLSQGTEILSQLSFEVNKSKMPHYDVLEKEMTAALSRLPADQRANPQAVQSVYQFVAGSAEGQEKIWAKKKEEMLRQQTQETPPSPGSGSNRSTGGGSGGEGEVPPPDKVLTPDNLRALEAAGKTPQQWADSQVRRAKCKDWDEYYEKVWKPYHGESKAV